MSICRARLRNTSNALTFRMSNEPVEWWWSPPSHNDVMRAGCLCADAET